MKRSFFASLFLVLLLGRASAVDSVVVFHELQFHPGPQETTGEWVELFNQMAVDIDLSGWHLEDGVNFTFPEGTIIPGGGYLVIASDPTALRSATGLNSVLGPFTGSLDNSGERLELRDRNERLMDRLTYGDAGQWPLAADGSGATLAKRHPNSTSAEPEHWTSSVVVGGTPGARNFPEEGAQLHSLISLSSPWRFEASGADAGQEWTKPTFDDRSWAGENGAKLVAYWPFNGDATAVRGTAGTLLGAVTATADRTGFAGGALAFGGASHYVSVPGGGGLNSALSGTISLWAQWSAGLQEADCCGSFGAVLARQGNGLFSDNILALSTANPLTAKLVWRQSGGPAPVLISATTAVGTGWRHVAVTFSPTGSTLYLDGVVQGSARGGPLHEGASVPLSIGAWAGDGGSYLKGSLDEVALWDRPLTAAQLGELAASTKTPLDFSGVEAAVYYSGDGRLTTNDELRQTLLTTGPTTYYFRKSFLFSDNPAHTKLALDLAVADGAVVFLNGTEVFRHNLPAGVVNHSTPALSVVNPAPLLTGIALPTASLVAGTNVLAVEVHLAEPANHGLVFGAALTATVTPPGLAAVLPDTVVFNELSAAADGPLLVELINRGGVPREVGGFILRRAGNFPDAQFIVPAQTLPPGAFLVLTEATLGFGANRGDKLFLLRPDGTAVADSIEVHSRRRARAPDGTGEFFTPTLATFGASNLVALHDEIVFNEIMYQAPPTLEVPASGNTPAIPYHKNPEQWIELLNRSAQAMDLSDWRLDGGIDFRFPAGTFLPAGGYLVVAKDPITLRTIFPALGALGPYTNSLSHQGERLVLRDAADNPADSVHYYDDGRWPKAADGGGSSLELRDPRADNAAGENWAASNESRRSEWKTYSYQGIATASSVGPDSQWREFVFGLLDQGEVLLDDLSVTESPEGTPIELLQNGAFSNEARSWRLLGNHHGTIIDDPDQPGNRVLRLIATGSTDHMSNHAETTFSNRRAVVNGRTYRISFRAKWISGCRQLNTRLYFNRLARTTILEDPEKRGTPGAENTAFVTNIGPTFSGLRHEPAVPAPSVPVTISVTAMDPDAVKTLTLWSRTDGGSWTPQTMTSDDTPPSRFHALVPGRGAGSIVQFYVEGTDSREASSTFPAAGPNSRALYQVDDGQAATNGLHNLRLVMLTADANELHETLNLMSNQRLGATLVYDEREVFYDVGLRLKGSEHSRTTSKRLGFNLGFNSEQLFRGVHRSVALDRSQSTGFGQREMLMNQVLNHCGGVPTKYHDLIQVIAPRSEHTGSAELQLARYSNVFLDDQYENGGEGMVFEYELIYQLNATDNGSPEGNKVPAPDSFVGTSIRNLGNDREGYRWTFLLKNNEDRDDYSRVIPFCQWMATSGNAFTSQIPTRIEVDQWLRGHAVNVLSGVGDSYGGDGSQHNVQFYVRPSDGRMLYFPHDLDAFYDANRNIVPNGDLAKIIAVPAYARSYYCHLLDIIETTHNITYLKRWADHFGQLLPGQPFSSHLAFIAQRNRTVTNAINAAVPPTMAFALTTNGGDDTSTTTSPFTLTGTANLSVKTIRVNGVTYPMTWTSRSAWSLSVPLTTGINRLDVQAVDRQGALLASATDTITVTNTGPGALRPVTINEWMAHNVGPVGFADPTDGQFDDWIELYNPNTVPVELTGYTLTDDLAEPAKWTFPVNTKIEPLGFLLIWADNDVAQNRSESNPHAAFQLSRSGESIGLFNAAGVAQHTLKFGPQRENVSEGLFPDGNIDAIKTLSHWTPQQPNSWAEPLKILQTTVTNGIFSFVWSTIPGHSYQVEYSETLGSSWNPLVPDQIALGETASVQENVATLPQRFYRVRRRD